MAYTGTYRAYRKSYDGTTVEWTGLRKTQAKWRYHWLRRLRDETLEEYGWEREWVA